MKFELKSATIFFTGKDKAYKDLVELGFKFEKRGQDFALDDSEKVFYVLKTMADLKKFIAKYGAVIIDDYSLTIYNGYVE